MLLCLIDEQVASILEILFIFGIGLLSKENLELLVKFLLSPAKALNLNAKLLKLLLLIGLLLNFVELVDFLGLLGDFSALLLVRVVDFHDLLHVFVVLELIIATLGCDFTLLHDEN